MVRRAVRAANRPPLGTTWRVEQVLEIEGSPVERYRLGAGPTLVLVPEPHGPATTVQVWLPFGWGHEPAARRGAARRWATGWPAQPLGPDHPAVHWRGAARDVSGASWTVAADDAPRALGALMGTWPTRTSTPSVSSLARLERRLRRAFWETTSAPTDDAKPDPADAVWVVAGRIDRATALAAARRALARPPGPPRAPRPRPRLGPGPRVPLEVDGPPEAQLALLGWSWPDPSPAVRTRLSALATLLTKGPQARLRPLLNRGAVRGLLVDVEPCASGVTVEALVNLGTASATVAAAGVRRAMAEIGEGRTTGLELERLRAELESARRRGWASQATRARRIAEAILVHDDLSALPALGDGERSLDEPSLRALARTLADKRPVVVRVRPR